MARTPRVVIIGPGSSAARWRTSWSCAAGRTSTVVEQGPLFATGGSTSHAPGLVFQTNALQDDGRVRPVHGREGRARSTLDGRWCFNPVGSLELALTRGPAAASSTDGATSPSRGASRAG